MAARWVKVGTHLSVHLLDFLSALIDLSEIPQFAYGFDLLAFRNIPRRLSYKLLAGLGIRTRCKIILFRIPDIT